MGDGIPSPGKLLRKERVAISTNSSTVCLICVISSLVCTEISPVPSQTTSPIVHDQTCPNILILIPSVATRPLLKTLGASPSVRDCSKGLTYDSASY